MRSCAHKVPTVYTLSYNLRSGNDKVCKVEKVTKINAKIISKPHANLQTMEKTCAKFQKVPYKSHKVEKVTKSNLTIISKPHAHPHTMTKTHAKFQKDQYKTVRGVALTRQPG